MVSLKPTAGPEFISASAHGPLILPVLPFNRIDTLQRSIRRTNSSGIYVSQLVVPTIPFLKGG